MTRALARKLPSKHGRWKSAVMRPGHMPNFSPKRERKLLRRYRAAVARIAAQVTAEHAAMGTTHITAELLKANDSLPASDSEK